MKEDLSVTKRPGGELAARPLHFIWILDVSESMANDGKIQALNNAIRETIPLMREAAGKDCGVKMLVRALTFSSGAQWHISQPTPIADFKWEDVSANGVTDMGRALSMVADQLKMPPMPERSFPPILVLLSDGQPTDDFKNGIRALMSQPWGKKAVRLAIAVGQDANLEVLQQFIGHPEIKTLKANSADSLTKYIRWVSTVATNSVVNPPSQPNGPGPKVDPIVPPPPPDNPHPESEVW